jgi:regulatory protein
MQIRTGPLDKFKKTYQLFLDDDLWETVHVSIFGNRPNFGEVQSVEELNEKFTSLEFKGAKNFVLRRLTQKNYHSAELEKALKVRLVSPGVISQILEDFIRLGYLNDEAWLSSFVRSLRLQKFGFNSILLKLRRKGISDDVAHQVIQEIKENELEEGNEQASIQKLLETRYKNRDLSIRKERDKVIAALVRKGYQFDDIFCVLRERYRGIGN